MKCRLLIQSYKCLLKILKLQLFDLIVWLFILQKEKEKEAPVIYL